MKRDDIAKTRLLTLLRPVHDRALMTARRLCRNDSDGDDLFQEAVLRAYAKLDTLRDDAAFFGWFYRILLSLHRTRMRQSVWKRWLSMDTVEEPVGEDGARWEVSRTSTNRMREALSTLPNAQREAVVLFELDGFTVQEIAEMQQASAVAVRTRLSRGRATLRRYYERLEKASKYDGLLSSGSIARKDA